MSPSASPANDWPRITVNTPTVPATIATSAPTTRRAGPSSREEPRRDDRREVARIATRPEISTRADVSPGSSAERARRAGAGDDEHAAVDAQDIDVVAVEAAQDVRGRPPRRCRSRRVRRRGRQRSITGNSGFISWAEMRTAIRCSAAIREQPDDLLGAAQVEVGQRLVEQQQRGRPISACAIRSLLLAPRSVPPLVGERLASTASTISSTRARRALEGSATPNRCPSIPSATRSRVRSGCRGEEELLRHVSDPASGAPADAGAHAPRGRLLEAQDDPEQGGLAGAVRADQPGELAGPDLQGDVIEDCRPPR